MKRPRQSEGAKDVLGTGFEEPAGADRECHRPGFWQHDPGAASS